MKNITYSNSERGDKRQVTECIPRFDLTAGLSCFNSMKLLPINSGFGSPVTDMRVSEQRASSDDDRDGCSRFLTSIRRAASMIRDKQSGSQLTIFYAGTVNVYHDIPADKVQAIMLMASSGNNTSYPHKEVPNGCGSQIEQKISVPVMKLSEGSAIHNEPSRTVHTDIPIAMKHSLQRFLEKRKDRVTVMAKGPYKTGEAHNPKAHDQHPSFSSPRMALHL